MEVLGGRLGAVLAGRVFVCSKSIGSTKCMGSFMSESILSLGGRV